MKTIKFIKMKRLWIPAIGWILAGGFFNNCILAPHMEIGLVDWAQLLTALGIMLGIGGARDIGLKVTREKDGSTTIEEISTTLPTKEEAEKK